jgi:hypothetical protein
MKNKKLESLERLPELAIEYSTDSEFQTTKWLLSPQKRTFFKEKLYRVTLPHGFSLEREADEAALKRQVEKEIDEEKTREIKDQLKKVWPEIIGRLRPVFEEIGYEMPERYVVSLTQYGPGGSYNPPNFIKVKIENNNGRSVEQVVAHEAVHIGIEMLIRKHKIGHWDKEHVVDLLMLKVDPNYRIQQVGIDTTDINMAFNQYYPNIEKILEEISRQRYN